MSSEERFLGKYYGAAKFRVVTEESIVNSLLEEGWEIKEVTQIPATIMIIKEPRLQSQAQPQKQAFQAEVSTTTAPPQVILKDAVSKAKEEEKAKAEEEEKRFLQTPKGEDKEPQSQEKAKTTEPSFSKSFKACKYCGGEIEWTVRDSRYVPLNTDGSVHNCKNR